MVCIVRDAQFLDDLLILGYGYGELALAAQKLKKDIEDAGLFVSEKKCILKPTKHLTWFGKLCTITDSALNIQPQQQTIADLGCLILWVSAKPFPYRVLHSLTGLLSWLTIHHRLCIALSPCCSYLTACTAKTATPSPASKESTCSSIAICTCACLKLLSEAGCPV